MFIPIIYIRKKTLPIPLLSKKLASPKTLLNKRTNTHRYRDAICFSVMFFFLPFKSKDRRTRNTEEIETNTLFNLKEVSCFSSSEETSHSNPIL